MKSMLGKRSCRIRQFGLLLVLVAGLLLTGSADAQYPFSRTRGTEATPRFGWQVAGLGDLDGDGLDDFAASAGVFSLTEKIRVISSATGTEIFNLSDTYGVGEFGYVLRTISDFDGDGFSDFMVGSRGHNANCGNPSSALLAELFVFSSMTGEKLLEAPGGYGESADELGDLNGDGVTDFIFGANDEAGIIIGGCGEPTAGRIRLISGTNATEIGSLRGNQYGDDIGYSAIGVGDLSGDGIPDFGYSDRHVINKVDHPRFVVRSGQPRSFFTLFTIEGVYPHKDEVSIVDDLNADGVPDLAILAGGTNSLNIYSGVDGALLHEIVGDDDWVYVGTVISLPDINGDGVGDIAAGIYDLNANPENTAIRIFSGADLADSSQGIIQDLHCRRRSGDGCGTSMSVVGDASGDGQYDLVVGAPMEDGLENSAEGAAYIFSLPYGNVETIDDFWIEGGLNPFFDDVW